MTLLYMTTTIVETTNIDNSIIETSNVNTLHQIPQKPVEKPPMENIMTLLEHIVNVRKKRPELVQKLNLLTDKDCSDIEALEEMEKVEEELKFMDEYTQNLQAQAVVIMNEHNVMNIPSIELIEQKLLSDR